jgi:hypothetical protein
MPRPNFWLFEQSLQKDGPVDVEVSGDVFQDAAQRASFQRCVTGNRDVVGRSFQG